MPSWRLKIFVAVAIGGLAYGLDRWLGKDGGSVLTAVVVGATIAYCWFTYDLVAAAETERKDRQRRELASERVVLQRMLVELKQNLHRKGQSHAWHAHVPFEMSAFDEARHLFERMPPDVWTHVAEISSRSARYNSVARYHNARVNPGSGMGDGAVTALAVEAHETQANAIPVLESWLAEGFGGVQPRLPPLVD
jgi:hypothetical protein